MEKTLRYCANDLTKLEISFREIFIEDYGRKIAVRFYIHDMQSDIRHSHVFKINNLHRLKKEDVDRTNSLISEKDFKCIKDVVINDDWRVEEDKTLAGGELHDFRKDDKYSKKIQITNEGIKYPLSIESLIAQSRIAQKTLLNLLYLAQKPVPEFWIKKKIYLPATLFEQECKILTDLEFISGEESKIDSTWFKDSAERLQNPGREVYNVGTLYNCLRLTAKGRERFERLHSGFGRTVFVIIWCKLKWLGEFFKELIEDIGYEAHIQELKEPEGEIGSDIRERIENCPLIIADLTGFRPNCFYELGYAHAFKKRAIITCRKSDVTEITIKGTEILNLPFDINQYRVTVWEEDEKDKFRAEIKQRLIEHKQAIEQDYFIQ